MMIRSGFVVICLGLMSGCATYETPPPKQLEFEPVKKGRFKSDEELQVALKVARAKCRAYGMQVAAGAPAPTMPQPPQVNVNVQTAPVYAPGPAALPQPHIPDSSSMINAYQAGAAARFRDDLFLSSAIACMAEDGWVVRE